MRRLLTVFGLLLIALTLGACYGDNGGDEPTETPPDETPGERTLYDWLDIVHESDNMRVTLEIFRSDALSQTRTLKLDGEMAFMDILLVSGDRSLAYLFLEAGALDVYELPYTQDCYVVYEDQPEENYASMVSDMAYRGMIPTFVRSDWFTIDENVFTLRAENKSNLKQNTSTAGDFDSYTITVEEDRFIVVIEFHTGFERQRYRIVYDQVDDTLFELPAFDLCELDD